MKTNNTLFFFVLFSVATIVALTISPKSFACSYFINPIAVENELGALGLTNLEVPLSELRSIEFSNVRWWESVSTPMCPEEMTYEASFQVKWQKKASKEICSAAVKVTKTEPWIGEDRSPEIKIETLSGPNCSR